MKAATIDQLRASFDQAEQWIEEGEEVQITKCGEPFARMTPALEREAPPAKWEPWPDVVARMREYCGSAVLSDEDTEKLFNTLRGERLL